MAAVKRLKTANDVRIELGRLYRAIEADQVEPTKARVLVYTLTTLGNLIRDTDLERRLEALEAIGDR